ncbi:DEAD/DEAH box helicase family protein [bacterium]|nr:DEAD/DEAH box helicase family protein [bacterium]
MNEAETRAELIDPKLRACGWGVVESSKILRERNVYHNADGVKITEGRIQAGGTRKRPLIADYILVYRGIKLAVVEAKSGDLEVGEGVAQAKEYAIKLGLETTYSTNGHEIYQICLKTGKEGLVDNFLSPQELWKKTYKDENEWREKFASIPYEDKSGSWQLRYYQELAVNKALEAIANDKTKILLTLATGTGKTAIAFQIVWKLFQSRWNLHRDGRRRPRVLFLADRNILADQAFNAFSAFPDDAMVRITPAQIRRRGRVPTNGSIFFTIFQSFMSGQDAEGNPEPYFGEYPQDYFDFIIIDECHRGGANNESNWRGILEYFSPAVQLGLTATPKRLDNIDTYKYFGEPVFVYSLKEGINDGFLTPFKVKRIKTTLDDYIYTSDDYIIEGEIEEGRIYVEADFNKIIEIKEREAKRVSIFMDQVDQKEKTIIFCATQVHAAAVRDLVNQLKTSIDPNYCVRVTANDGDLGEQYLRQFQDNEKSIPTVLTTSQKLSTGVDARNIRNIVLMRPVNSMIEFKQIIGRGTRLFEGKDFFTIYDFVDAYHHFADHEWDGEPIAEICPICGEIPCVCPPKDILDKISPYEKDSPKVCQKCGQNPCICKKRVKIKLRDGKEREIQYMIQTSFWSADGKPISTEEFLHNLFGELPNFFKSEEELQKIWSNPTTRKKLLEGLEEAGFGKNELQSLQKLIDAENSDLYDVLEYVFNSDIKPISRLERVSRAKAQIMAILDDKQRDFIDFILSKYVESGVYELDQDKLPTLLQNKYQSLEDALAILGDVTKISSLFIDFQKYLYLERVV